MSELDDFSKRRLAELPPIHELRKIAMQTMLRHMEGMMLATYSRRDLDILRMDGHLNGHELAFVARLDKAYEDNPTDRVDDLSVCAHCGESLARVQNIITVPSVGRVVAYHGSRKPCARAAGWRRLPSSERAAEAGDGAVVTGIIGQGD